jgi:hypothetical protein
MVSCPETCSLFKIAHQRSHTCKSFLPGTIRRTEKKLIKKKFLFCDPESLIPIPVCHPKLFHKWCMFHSLGITVRDKESIKAFGLWEEYGQFHALGRLFW